MATKPTPSPTARQIVQRAGAIRRGWSARVERERRVQPVEPIIYTLVAVEDIGAEWKSISL